jgi:integrase
MISGHVEDRNASWRIVIELDHENGKRDRTYKSVKKKQVKTRPEVERIMNRMIIEMEQGDYVEPSGYTLSKYLDKWLEYMESKLEYTTRVRYKGIIDSYFKPELGHIKLENLKPLQIEDHYAWLQSHDEGCPGLAANTVIKHYNMLHKALKQAVRWKLMKYNPADSIDPPTGTKYEAPVLPDRKSIRALLDRLLGTFLYLPVIIALTTSLRRGEICGLRWLDIDWDNGRIFVRHVLIRIVGEGVKPKPRTKNKKARSVALPPTILALLQHEYATRYEGSEDEDHGEDYVCIINGHKIAPDYLTHRFAKLAKSNITFHGCRHSHDTWLLRHKVDPKLVADRAGRGVGLTQRLYEHVLPDMQDEVAMLIERTLFGPEEKPENDEKK